MTYAHLGGYKQTLLARDSSPPPAAPRPLTQMHAHPQRLLSLPLSIPFLLSTSLSPVVYVRRGNPTV